MRRARSLTPLLLVAALAADAGCTGRHPPAPVITAMDPSFAPGDVAKPIRVLGENFLAMVTVDFDSPAASTVDDGFALWLTAGDVRVPLEDVRLVSDHELAAVLPELATAPGIYDLDLQDPRGARATLPAAFEVLISDCAAQPDGTPCGSANCIAGGTCQAGACACVNTSPLACFTVTPGAGAEGTTVFVFDASCSSDYEDPRSALQVRFDFQANGTFETPWTTAKTFLVTYVAAAPSSAPQVVTAYAEARDTGGLVAFAERRVVVFEAGDGVEVTTDSDSGAGSLREAIAIVNGPPAPGLTAPHVITFAANYDIVLASALPPLQANGAAIVGRPGLHLDCSAVSEPCLTLAGADQGLFGLSVSGSPGVSIQIDGTGALVAQCRIRSSPTPSSVGIQVAGEGTVGPRNDVSGAATGIRLASAAAVVDANRVHGNTVGVFSVDSTATVQRNLVYANTSSGIQVTNTTGAVRFNTCDANGADGLSPTGSGQMDVRDNLFTNNDAYGVGGPIAGLSPFDHNGYFGNGRGPIGSGAPAPTDLTVSPRYVDRAGGDFRLLPGSPAVNAGVDVGLDVNGPESGNYNGTAPDLGAAETPY